MTAGLARLIDHWSVQRPARVALRFEGETVRYGELARRVDALTGQLLASGIGRGDRIAWLGLNHPLMLVMLFACARMGAIFIPLNFRLTPHEHAEQFGDSQPALIVVEAALDAHLDEIGTRHPLPPRLAAEALWQRLSSPIRTIHAAGDDAAPGGSGDDVLLVYTSGTSGRPKGVLLTQAALLANCINSVHAHDLTSQDHVLTVLPMFHVGGLNIMTLPALYVGAEVTLQARFDAGRLLADIETLRPTLTLLVPATMAAAISHPAWRDADLSSLRQINCGSSIVPTTLIEAFHARGVPVGQVYGATETCPIALVLRAEDALRKVGSTGVPAMHCEARLIGPDGTAVARGEVGEIQIRGQNVMRGYHGQAEATAAAFAEGGWYRTGDLARQDDDGYYWVAGRAKDMIISGGENIYPAELEAVLADCAAIADAAVIGLPDERWGEVPVAVVIRNRAADPGERLDEAAVLSLFDGRLARYKHPKRVVFVTDMPRTSLGKVQKAALAKLLSAGPAPHT